ncbi:MAG: NAD-dependent epimerase/dehydratase family protein [Gemmobacter sp.]
MRILITGATGCVAQYLTRELLARTDAHLVLLSRDAARIAVPPGAAGRVTLASGRLEDPASYGAALEGVTAAALVATAWGGPLAHATTVVGNAALADLLIDRGCRHVVYFSSASVLLPDGSLNPVALDLGTDYIRTKHQLVAAMEPKAARARISGVFPTIVMGGRSGPDPMPLSELAKLLVTIRRWHWLIARVTAEGRFNITHAADIATIVRRLIEGAGATGGAERHVAGLPPASAAAMIAEVLAAAGRRHRPLLRLTPRNVDWAIRAFRLQVTPWDRWCMANPDQGYDRAITPAAFGAPVAMPSLTEGLRMIGYR